MNRAMISYVLGGVLRLTGVFLMVPVLCSVIYRENEGLPYFIIGTVSIIIGVIFTFKKPNDSSFFLKEGCVTTALSWILLSIVGALPFYLTGEIPYFLDAIFETASGFTTTGASIIGRVEDLSHTALLWRSFTHWLGGMGVLVFLLAVLPLTGGGSINLMRAESPGPSVGKLVPKIRHTARILYGIYLTLTVVMIILLLILRMPLFDSICTALGTAGTGGFGIHSDSIGSYSTAIQWVVTVFMILFGVNFNAYFFIIMGEFKRAFSIGEVKVYFLIILAAVIAITFNISGFYATTFEAVTASAFQVGSIITTTGFCTADFNQWPPLSQGILVMLMFVGACAGSTGGGMKVSRIVFQCKSLHRQVFTFLHPRAVNPIKIDNQIMDEVTHKGLHSYFAAYLVLFSLSTIPLLAEGNDIVTSFTAVAATFNNIGPGLAAVGPTENFAALGGISKCVLIFDMLAGRLEIFPILVLLSPSLWMSKHKF